MVEAGERRLGTEAADRGANFGCGMAPHEGEHAAEGN